ncbi:hypothetical protein LTR62_000051 [Meristemomyces frigidus]|uniref:Uncharacterized protein n=1 Tax=Meristemomyces frigidus TaxID=1508187 RepID=A0AAN7YNL8_9PEZI|nr:hypothetical protein LTR62_000051 [Meristemomyces frigidus]
MPPKRTQARTTPAATQCARAQVLPRPPRVDSFDFLGLPAELRNSIYELLAAGCDRICIQATSERSPAIAVQHSMNGVNRQTREEFLDILGDQTLVTPRSIYARVIDFDFSTLQAYIKQVLKRDAQAFFEFNPVVDAPGRRRLHVDLDITARWLRMPGVRSLENWFRFVRSELRRCPEQMVVKYHFANVADKAQALASLKGYHRDDVNLEKAGFGSIIEIWQRYGSPTNMERIWAKEARRRAMRKGTQVGEWYMEDEPELQESWERQYQKSQ